MGVVTGGSVVGGLLVLSGSAWMELLGGGVACKVNNNKGAFIFITGESSGKSDTSKHEYLSDNS